MRFRAPAHSRIPVGLEFASSNPFGKAVAVVQGDAIRFSALTSGIVEISSRLGLSMRLALLVANVMSVGLILVMAGVIGDADKIAESAPRWKLLLFGPAFVILTLGGTALAMLRRRYLVGDGQVMVLRTFLWFQVSHRVTSCDRGFPVIDLVEPPSMEVRRIRFQLEDSSVRIHTSARESFVLPMLYKAKHDERIAQVFDRAGWEYLGETNGPTLRS